MRTYWWPGHATHDPGRLAQPAGSSPAYFSEVAQRAELIVAAVHDAGLGAVIEVAPGADDGVPDAVGAVHDAEMLELLRTVHAGIVAAEGLDALGPDPVVVGETFLLPGDPAPSASRSLRARLGRRCADTSAPIFAGTWDAARAAAEAAVAAAADVATGALAAYALCRPPGHHARRAVFGGFCYLNNAAIAAEHLASTGRRVAVVDVDLHHGNGTQDVFWDRADVLYASLHIDPDLEYPYFAGFADEIGGAGAEGANLNLPLARGCDEQRYLDALHHAVAAVRGFGPDVLVVSLGTDTHRLDPIGSFALETGSYPRIGERLAALGLPTVVVQEGGYHLPSLGADVSGFLGPFS